MVIKVGKNEIVLFDDPSNLTLNRFKEYNKYLLIDSGIGTSTEGIHAHIMKLIEFNKSKDNIYFVNEVTNLMQGFFNIANKNNVSHYAFAVLIKSINNIEYNDYSQDGLDKVISHLDDIGLTHDVLTTELESLKKKIQSSLEIRFPKYFNKSLEFWFVLKDKLLEECKHIQGNESNIESLQIRFNNVIKPLNFKDKESAELKYDVGFEEMCASLRTHTPNKDIKELTIVEAYSLITILDKNAKPN